MRSLFPPIMTQCLKITQKVSFYDFSQRLFKFALQLSAVCLHLCYHCQLLKKVEKCENWKNEKFLVIFKHYEIYIETLKHASSCLKKFLPSVDFCQGHIFFPLLRFHFKLQILEVTGRKIDKKIGLLTSFLILKDWAIFSITEHKLILVLTTMRKLENRIVRWTFLQRF